MNALPSATTQAAAEYAATAAGSFSRSLGSLTGKVGSGLERAWGTATADPILATGVFLVVVLFLMILRAGRAR